MPGALPYDPDQVPVGERKELLDRTPEGAKVLDVGCWAGFAGRYLAETRGATVDGIEPVGEMAALAAESYRRVWAEPVESALETIVASECTYDAILFLDVLEHLVAPGDVLAQARALLSPGGSIRVSLPNVAHWSIRAHLVRGRWNYADSGILDRTHLRWFTLRTARELLETAGWRIVLEDAAIDYRPLLPHSPVATRVMRRWPALFGVQLLFEATVAPRPPK